MSNQVAEAIALCEAQIKEWHEVFDEVVRFTNSDFQKRQIFAWTTHLAEFEEHQPLAFDDRDYCSICQKYEEPMMWYPCDFITTKAQRLLGEETK